MSSPIVRAFVLSPSWSMTSGDGPTNARPACSTLRANSAFSDKKPYLRVTKCARSPILRSLCSIADGGEAIPGVDHIHSMLEGDADDVVLCEVCSDGGETLANLVGFIGLQERKDGCQRP